MDDGGSCPQKKWMSVEIVHLYNKDIERYNQINK